MKNEYSVITTTFPEKKTAKRVAKLLVEKKLAACVQMLPVYSTYRWQGEIFEEDEFKLLIKSRTSLFDEIAEAIKKNHSYDTLEIIQIPIIGGSEEYQKWIADMTRGTE